MDSFYQDKTVLITGAAGTVGKELTRQLLTMGVREVRALDNNEAGLFYLNNYYRNEDRYHGFFCDVRDFDKLKFLCKKVDIILHAAAMKHVIISELNPLDAIKTNVNGTSNVIQAALESDSVRNVIYTSSDKAVNPTNVMGTSKLLGERLMSAAINKKYGRDIIFSSTRFGNVIGSKGSVVPIFYKQIKEGKKLTVTHEEMTRFVMTTFDAASLVLKSCVLAKGAEVFVTKMPVVKIVDLAEAMINLVATQFDRDPRDFEIEYIGALSGEKMYEELMTEAETTRAIELDEAFLVRPVFSPTYEQVDYLDCQGFKSDLVKNPYISSKEPLMSREEIEAYFVKNRILEQLEF